jgi:hypothetical protein
MSKVLETLGLRNGACKRLVTLAAASSECESGCCLHGVFPEEKVAMCYEQRKLTESFYVLTSFLYVRGTTRGDKRG